jgi:hypothetical protein
MDPTLPIPADAFGPGEAVILNIGEIAVSSTMVHTPTGSFPLRGSQWNVIDQWSVVQRIPRWAVVLSIVGFCVLTVFSLLFLLARENVYSGIVTVSVSNGPYSYVARLPVTGQPQVQHVYQQVNYVRALALV